MFEGMRVAVLTGGNSPEREVSLKTSASVEKALKKLGVKNKVVYAEGNFIPALQDGFEMVFIAMHGGLGENGCIQGLLQTLGIPYAGSGVLSSALCMNKIISKKLFSAAGIRTAPWQVLDSAEELKIKLPVVVKPADGGSTIGTVIVKDKNRLKEAFEEAKNASAALGGTVMAEKYIPGREITVGILNSKALPLLEIRSNTEFYDYRAKYEEGMSEHLDPADIDSGLKKRIQKTAEKAFEIARCRDMGRVDFRLNGRKFYILEINTIPGMTPTSLLPEAAQLAGIEFEKLVKEILENVSLRA